MSIKGLLWVQYIVPQAYFYTIKQNQKTADDYFNNKLSSIYLCSNKSSHQHIHCIFTAVQRKVS